ncbi:MAG: NADPH-dependent F420 reductase [Candidatus Dormibacteria bacterium]
MRVAIIGTGQVGQALGRGFVSRGHETRLASRTPGSDVVQAWLRENGDHSSAGTPAEAARWCELAVLATNWEGVEASTQACAPTLGGKTVIDVTNPLRDGRLELGHTDSGGEAVQRWLPDSHVVKAFNILNFGDMVDPTYRSGTPTMFMAGNDDAAKHVVTGILESFGWSDVVDLGGIEAARLTESLAMLWITCGLRAGGSWRHAISLLRPSS